MKGLYTILIFLLLCICSGTSIAFSQPTKLATKKTNYRIALFAPLFLDSAFDQQAVYRYPNKTFPKYITPGLELVEGALLALDTLNKLKAPIELVIIDTRSVKESLRKQLDNVSAKNVDLLITHCTTSELQILAAFGYEKNIPIINVNLPNDAGITNNPFLVLLNSTLRTQSVAISKYVQTKFPKQRVVVFRKKGMLEDLIHTYWDEFAKANKGMQKWTYVDLSDSFTANQLISKLDTLQPTVCLAGSLDESFGKQLALQLASLTKQHYRTTLMGMPTWDAIREFSKPAFQGIDIIYCSPYYNARTDSVSQQVQRFFYNNLYAKPSDMALRGYEAVWRFAQLLLRYGKSINSQLTAKEFDLFREIQIQPVLNESKQVQYFENKKLYFLKWQDGTLKLIP